MLSYTATWEELRRQRRRMLTLGASVQGSRRAEDRLTIEFAPELDKRLRHAIDRALAHGEGRAIVLIGIQDVDDAVIAAAEARMLRTIRPSDLIGRLSRERFAVLAATSGGLDHAERLAVRLAGRLREPFNVGGK